MNMIKSVTKGQKIETSGNNSRTKCILLWLKKIGNSELSLPNFYKKYDVPFSRSQYFLYKNKL